MGLSINTVRSGINYVLKAAKNETFAPKLSIFEGVEGSCARKLASTFDVKPPLMVTNPFEKKAFNDIIFNDNANKIIEFLDSFDVKYPKVVQEMKTALLEHPDVLNTFPTDRINARILSALATNPQNWNSEYAKIPFNKIKSDIGYQNYIRSILNDPAQAVYKFDEKYLQITFGNPAKNLFSSFKIFDLESIKTANGHYDKKKLIEFFDNIKGADNSDKSIAGLKSFLERFPSSSNIVEKYPNTTEYILNNIVDGRSVATYEFKNATAENLKITEEFLATDSDYSKKSVQGFNDLVINARAYNVIVQAPLLKNIPDKNISKACEIFKGYSFGYTNFRNLEDELQQKVIKFSINLNENDKKQFDYLLKTIDDKNIIERVIDKPELLPEINKNAERLEKLFQKQKCANQILKNEIIHELAIMKTLTPSEFQRLKVTQGFKNIVSGHSSLSLLKGVRYNSGDEFFNHIYGNIEQLIEKSTVYKELNPLMQDIYKKVVMYDPSNAQAYIHLINNAKDKTLICKSLRIANSAVKRFKGNTVTLLKDGYHVDPKELAKSRKQIFDFIECSAKNPEDMKFAFQFDGQVSNILALAKNPDKKLIPIDMLSILASNKNKFSTSHVNSIIKYLKSGEDPKLIDDMIKITLSEPKSTFLQMAQILDNTSHNNVNFIKNRIAAGNLSDLSVWAYFTKDLKQFSYEPNQAKILKDLEKLIDLGHQDLSWRNRRTIKSLLEVKANFPEKYTYLDQSGIFDYIKTTGEQISVLDHFNENAKLSEELLADLKLWKEGKSIVPTFSSATPLQTAFAKTKTGDVVEIGDKLYINDGNELYPWNMTKDKYLELFPPVKRFMTSQRALKDCYFVSSLNSIMRNPQARAQLYKSFEQSGNDIKFTINAYKDFDGVTTFKDSLIKLDNSNKHISGCKGLQMAEQAYAKKALRMEIYDITGAVSAENNQKLMSRIQNGYTNDAMHELLGLTYNGTFIKEVPQDLHKSAVRVYGGDMHKSLTETLNRFGNDSNYMLGFGTRPKSSAEAESVILKDYSLVSSHAYSIVGYNPDKNIVTISNPHNSGLNFDIPVDTLAKYINNIYIASQKV